jgi:hypothetical protein
MDGPLYVFVKGDLELLHRAGLPALPQDNETALIDALNFAFDSAESVACLEGTHTPSHAMKDFYQSVAAHAAALLAALGYDDTLITACDSNVRTAPWRWHISRMVPAGASLPSDVRRASIVAVPRFAQDDSVFEDFPPDDQLSPEERSARHDRERVRQAIDGLPSRLELVRLLALIGADQLAAEMTTRRKSGDRPDRYMKSLMLGLASAYAQAYGVKPKFDCNRGDLKGPTAQWIDDVIGIAAQRARDNDAAQIPSEEARIRITGLDTRAPETLASLFKEAFQRLRKNAE